MRAVRNIRKLATGEIHLAQTVFKHTINYDEVLISDGLGWNNRELTLPTSLPVTMILNVPSSEGDYVIHAGDGYLGMSTLPSDRNTLIHELTHVWQGQHQYNSAAFYGLIGLVTQLGDDPYPYDHDHFHSSWDLYNMEQQAQIVEDWFSDGMKEYNPDKDEGDPRFYFIKTVIRGEKVAFNWLLPAVRPLPSATLVHDWSQEPEAIRGRLNAIVLPIIKVRFAASDTNGPSARVNRLADIFGKLTGLEAAHLWKRLQARSPGDELARNFFANLSPHSITRLTAILKTRSGPFI